MMNSIFIVALLASACLADLYMHQFRGSNNRLNEKSANRQNGNRLCDTQNNNRGGYNVGELGATNGFANDQNAFATDATNFDYTDTTWSKNGNAGNKQFEEVFLEGSKQSITWTAQHGCGNNKNNCNMVVEYTCDSHDASQQAAGTGILDQTFTSNTNAALQRQDTTANANFLNNWADPEHADYTVITGLRVMLSNGANTNTPNDPNNVKNSVGTFKNNNGDNEGRHEPEEAYAFAKQRLRNKNLFTADQKLQGDDTTKTRQNPGGTRRGLETPEERDYFPYWLPSIWRPVAIAHNNVQECETQMRAKSSAIETKTACVPYKNQLADGANEATAQQLQNILRATSKNECENTVNNGATDRQGKWIEQKYDMPPGYPQCVQNTWSQVNNLGNVADTPEGGLPQNWDWTIPTLDQLKNSGCYVYETTQGQTGTGAAAKQRYVRMVMRMRYNMTTMDYSPYETDANCNQGKKRQSPVQQNPTVDVGVEMQGLRLAINTAQTGRTFQDRSHVFRVMAKPLSAANNAPVATLANKNIINVSVQGKRGNIVQTFPAVEYDFWPKIVNMNVGDCLAFQWTGSNTHNNGNPGGDGQTGDAGEGRGGSDRSNLMQLMDKNSTFPAPLDKIDQLPINDFFKNSDVYQTYTGKKVNSGEGNTPMDAQLYFMSGGFYQGESDVASPSANIGGNNNNNGNADAAELNVLLNNAPASMRSMTVCPKLAGTYDFTCTRNNNFSNRDQKLTINVNQATQG